MVSGRDPRIAWPGCGGSDARASQTPEGLPWGCSLARRVPGMERLAVGGPGVQNPGIWCPAYLPHLFGILGT